MFILYAIVLGVIVGLLAGGRADGLAALRFRWAWLFVAGLAVQLVLFSAPVAARVGDLGVPIYVASTALVAAAVVANLRVRGMALVVLGAACNLAAILANSGYMPASESALAASGRVAASDYSNSSIAAHPALGFLTDIFALPRWLPLANVFSVGDVLIGAGVLVVIAAAMRETAQPAAAVSGGSAAAHGGASSH